MKQQQLIDINRERKEKKNQNFNGTKAIYTIDRNA